jgi:hypothetical protein
MCRECFLLAALVLFSTLRVHSQQYPFIQISSPPSATQLMIIMQDSVGRIWVGGTSGASVYDGTRFIQILDSTG